MSQAHSHGGHRGRLRARYQGEGLSGFQPHEVLELMLYTTIPQRDVNPLAHQLIDRFGSVGAVLNAPAEQLIQVPGIGAQTAAWLNCLGESVDYYASLNLRDRPLMNSARKLSRYCAALIDPPEEPQIWVLSMNLTARLYNSTCVARGRAVRDLSLRAIVEPTLRYHARALALLQNRPTREVFFQKSDVDFTLRLAGQLSSLHVLLLDHIFMCPAKTISMRQESLYDISRYVDVEQSHEVRELCAHWLDP